jgi:acetyl esterase/lipase
MKLFLEIFLILIASVNLLLTWLALFRLHQPTTLFAWAMKVFTSAISPLLLLAGLMVAVFGFILNSLPAMAMGSCSALLFLIHIIVITRRPDRSTDFESAFGSDWLNNVPPEIKDYFLRKRYVFRLPDFPEPIVDRNVSFFRIPGGNRQLLCDVWQPPKNVRRSGVGFIYLHGSAWTFLDKDYGTRPFFRHLARQGHVIMDVAYRLFPETDFMGMVHDAKHAIAWMKAHAAEYGVRTNRVVIGGGSAGGHLALLAAYTNHDNRFTPIELESVDLSVCGVISLYGQSDLVATYYHTCQHLTTQSALGQQKNSGHGGMPRWMQKRMGKNYHRLGFDKDVQPGMLAPMLAGTPEEKSQSYSLFSPLTHVHMRCPPTLILHGEQDILAPVKAIQQLYSRLTDAGVPVVMHVLPQIDHAFDVILPKISPSAQNAFYDVERFLAIMAFLPTTTVSDRLVLSDKSWERTAL